MDPLRRLRQIGLVLVAVSATLAGGTIGFHQILDESWFQSFYRAIITATLTGLDTVPRSDAARALSIAMALGGLTIIAYAGAVIVEAISGGVITGALSERRRLRAIDDGGGCTSTCSAAGTPSAGRSARRSWLSARP